MVHALLPLALLAAAPVTLSAAEKTAAKLVTA